MSVQALSCAFAVRGITASEKLVLLALANYADDKMRCWPSQEKIAADTELSDRTVWGALKSMEARHLISRVSRKRTDGTRTTDVFTLHFAGEVASDPLANPANSTRKSCENQSQTLRTPVAAVATLTTFEPSIEEPIDPDKSASASLPLTGAAYRAWKGFPEAGRRRSSAKLVKAHWAAAARAAGGAPVLEGCVERFASSDEASRDQGRFVKGMHLWLRDGFWEHWLAEPPRPVTEIDPWPQRVREFRRNQYWNTTDWGPKPGKPGCIVPQSALEVA